MRQKEAGRGEIHRRAGIRANGKFLECQEGIRSKARNEGFRFGDLATVLSKMEEWRMDREDIYTGAEMLINMEGWPLSL